MLTQKRYETLKSNFGKGQQKEDNLTVARFFTKQPFAERDLLTKEDVEQLGYDLEVSRGRKEPREGQQWRMAVKRLTLMDGLLEPMGRTDRGVFAATRDLYDFLEMLAAEVAAMEAR